MKKLDEHSMKVLLVFSPFSFEESCKTLVTIYNGRFFRVYI